ncbi:MAG: septal ring lytic transglycosylase RlpA family protein [Halothiobacillus sp.]
MFLQPIAWPSRFGAWGWVAACSMALLAGCSSGPRLNPGEATSENAVPRFEHQPNRINPPSYNVLGRTYRVLSNNAGYDAQGVASWYGPDFQSKSTSSGERYNMYAMTAAHKTLRIPAFVQVTNMENGKQAIVRVNDRGPFVSNRIIDLSYAAAKKIGMIGKGTAMVDIKVITPDSPAATTYIAQQPAPSPVIAPQAQALAQRLDQNSHLVETPAPQFSGASAPVAVPQAVWGQDVFIQVGAFSDVANVMNVRRRLELAGLRSVTVMPFGGLSRVRVGPVGSLSEYDQTMDQLRTIGFEHAQMVVE